MIPQRVEQSETVQPWHHHIGQHEVGRIRVNAVKRGLTISHRIDLIALTGKQSSHILTHVGIIISQEDASTSVECWSKR